MTILFFDTETTGLPPRGSKFVHANAENFLAWRGCRVVQIAWEIRSEMDQNILIAREFLVKPNGFTVPKEASKIHGITHERAEREGCDIRDVLVALIDDIASYNVTLVVAHNISFDDNVVRAELYRLNQSSNASTWISVPKKCTMRLGTKPGGRWPKLEALYRERVGENIPGVAHTAATDTRMCAEVYYKLVS